MDCQEQLRLAALKNHVLLVHQQSQISALQAHLQTLEQNLTIATTQEHNATSSLAKAECTQLCSRITTHLPRELRDMIYQYLLPIEPVHITREYFRSGMDPVTKLHCYDATRWREVHHPQHFWDAQYVTPGFLAELKERYYLTTTFTFGDDEGVIERFLTTDHLDLGFGPVDLVSMVEVHLTALTFDRSCCMSYLFGLATKPERLEAAIRGLEKLRSGTNVVVKFNTRAKDEEQRTSQAETARKSLAPGLERVRERGCSVSFVIDGSVETDVVSGAKSR